MARPPHRGRAWVPPARHSLRRAEPAGGGGRGARGVQRHKRVRWGDSGASRVFRNWETFSRETPEPKSRLALQPLDVLGGFQPGLNRLGIQGTPPPMETNRERHSSPGQRPGQGHPRIFPSPERALKPMVHALKPALGRPFRAHGVAWGRWKPRVVAPGWNGAAPLGRRALGRRALGTMTHRNRIPI
jgi:hypothetical protein